MSNYFKDGINRIKETRQYAKEKNVPNWYMSLATGIFFSFIGCMIFSLYSILFISQANPNGAILNFIGYGLVAYPFVLTFFFVIQFGKYPIKAMIYFTYLIQKGFMKLITKIDMYMWRKYKKENIRRYRTK